MKKIKSNQSGDYAPQDDEVKPTISVDIDPLSQLLDLKPGKAPSESISKRSSLKKTDRK